jgi:hypothetical protein
VRGVGIVEAAAAIVALLAFAFSIYALASPHTRHQHRVDQCHLQGGAWVDEGDFCVRRLP